jgi:hypothetical protein
MGIVDDHQDLHSDPNRGWIPVISCKDIVGDSSISSSWRSSMRNNLLHSNLILVYHLNYLSIVISIFLIIRYRQMNDSRGLYTL